VAFVCLSVQIGLNPARLVGATLPLAVSSPLFPSRFPLRLSASLCPRLLLPLLLFRLSLLRLSFFRLILYPGGQLNFRPPSTCRCR
jgi:hypothetical protein